MPNVESLINHIKNVHPEITGDNPISVITEGSANIVLVVESGKPWIFRFPRDDNPTAPRQMKREQWILPRLMNRVPYIPQVSIVSERPIPYIGYPKINGTQLLPAYFSKLQEEKRERLAKDLARFLSTLHSFQAEAYFPQENTRPSFVKRKWENKLNVIKELVFPDLNDSQRDWTLRLFDSFLSNDKHFEFHCRFIHGDLKPQHILVDERTKQLTGVIDLGLMMDDPALDFGYLGFGSSFQNKLLKHYKGFQDETFPDRILFYKKTIPFYGLLYGAINKRKEVFKDDLQLLNEFMAEDAK
ncbi:phosphotransferase family protein [Cohnella sp. GCM10027633]|uniref:phosphotransferase family protein n=1 Tax=unclassified Cohnella TaxID=2636738 RepID=UPI003645182E